MEHALQSLTSPNKATYASLLKRCGDAKALKLVHAHMVKSGFIANTFLCNHLVLMYGNCGSLEEAYNVFNRTWLKNVFSWNIMIAAYAQNGDQKAGIKLYYRMQHDGMKPDKITFVNVLAACTSSGIIAEGDTIYRHVLETGFYSDLIIGTSLINMYGRFKNPHRARDTFNEMPQKNAVAWTAMITAYGQNGYFRETIDLYRQMEPAGVNPDEVTFISILNACISFGAIEEGRAVHSHILFNKFETDVRLMNALVNMYGKCGYLEEAKGVFNKMVRKDEVTWTALIAAYAQHGHTLHVVSLLQLMSIEGLATDEITFISVLFACSHSGMLEQGWRCFTTMVGDYGVAPILDHYLCMIDILGRLGHLEEAEDLISNMPFQPDSVSWATVIGACSTHGGLNRAFVSDSFV